MNPEIFDHIMAIVLYYLLGYVLAVIAYEQKMDLITHDKKPLQAFSRLSMLLWIVWIISRLFLPMTMVFGISAVSFPVLWTITYEMWRIHDSNFYSRKTAVACFQTFCWLVLIVLALASVSRLIILING